MKKIFGISLIFIVLNSIFSVLQAQTYRIEAGYSQPRIYSTEISNRYFHGVSLGATAEFDIPQVSFLTLQTGISYSYSFGNNAQKGRFAQFNDSIRINTQGHQLNIPIHLQASQTIFRVIRATVFVGPNINIGLSMPQKVETNISSEWWDYASLNGYYQLGTTDLYNDRLRRFNLQMDTGLAAQWWKLQVKGGYSFGLNNLNKWQQPADVPVNWLNVSGDRVKQRQSGWFVSIGYEF
jgi:hypothetical protein